MKIYKLIFIFIFICITCLPVRAKDKSCRWYPYKTGLKIKNKNKNNLKIYSTSKVKVFFDDFEEIEDSYKEAEDNAIVKIARYLETDIKYNKKYFLLNDENAIKEGNNIKESKKETVKSNFDSKISLSGIKMINKCYEKNNFVKVTVLLDEKNFRKANKFKSIFKNEQN